MSDRILAIDPGSEQSAWVVYDGRPQCFGITANEALLELCRVDGIVGDRDGASPTTVVIERIESYGMPVGVEVFETVRWAGRFEEACHPSRVEYLPRRAVKLHLCNSAKAKDPNIRQALLDRFGPQGTKAAPGTLYGVAKDVWAALAVAVTYADTHEEGTDA